MTITTTILADTAEYTDVREVDASTGYVGLRRDWKPGSAPYNRDQIRIKLAAARQTFRDNYANWATLSAAQKDTAARNAQRALGNILGSMLEQYGDPGD